LKRLRKKEGVALITSLMVIALLVTVVVEFNRIAVADIDISRNFGDEKKVLFTTISGVNAIKELLRLDRLYSEGDTLLEGWARSRPHFEAASSILDEGTVEGDIIDENGRIDVNSLVDDKGEFDENQKAIWKRLLGQSRFGLAEETINTIMYSVKDWIDKDDELTGIYGAEDSFYRGRGYHAKNNVLHSLDEMLLVNGVNENIYYGDRYKSGIRRCFTVYGGPKININTAPHPVLMALSDHMTEDIAMEMDIFRSDDANIPQLKNIKWYKKVWPFEDPLPESLLSTSSDFFTVNMRGTLRKSVKEVRAVLFRSDISVNVVYWQEM
jgi:general secretion pathway protein K